MDKKATKTRTRKAPINLDTGKPVDAKVTRFETLRKTAHEHGIELPSWKRSVCALVGAAATAYGVGAIASAVTTFIATAALAVSTNMFLHLAIWALGIIAALYFGLKASQKVGMYIATGDIDADLLKLKNKVSGFFKKPELAMA